MFVDVIDLDRLPAQRREAHDHVWGYDSVYR